MFAKSTDDKIPALVYIFLVIYYRYEEYIVSLQYAPMLTNTKPE